MKIKDKLIYSQFIKNFFILENDISIYYNIKQYNLIYLHHGKMEYFKTIIAKNLLNGLKANNTKHLTIIPIILNTNNTLNLKKLKELYTIYIDLQYSQSSFNKYLESLYSQYI